MEIVLVLYVIAKYPWIPISLVVLAIIINIHTKKVQTRKAEQEYQERKSERIRKQKAAEEARSLRALDRDRHQQATKASRELKRLHGKLSAPSSVSALSYALADARSDFQAINAEALNASLDTEYEFVRDLLAQSDSVILNRYIQSRLDDICHKARSPMSLDAFYHSICSLFAEIDRASAQFPPETRSFVRKLRERVGLS